MSGLEDLGEVALADHLPDIVLASHVHQDAEVLHEFEPLLDRGLLLLLVLIHAVREHDHFVQEPDYDALLQVEASRRAASVFAAEHHSLRRLLQRYQVDLAVLDVEGFAAGLIAAVCLELVQLALEEDEEALLVLLDAVFLQEVDVQAIANVLELGDGLLAWQYHFSDVQLSL